MMLRLMRLMIDLMRKIWNVKKGGELMRCPNCGGIMSHFLIANGGRNYYICRTGLTGIRDDRLPVRGDARIFPCHTVLDEDGKVVEPGTILVYEREGKYETCKVGELN